MGGDNKCYFPYPPIQINIKLLMRMEKNYDKSRKILNKCERILDDSDDMDGTLT